mmetsp:Transcript_5543/g.8601  ORF Transcript_5543/g.8601 Transcript_5543/m.8601 type:complete len:142 (-) Transcript_5543:207-632(-)|eukprot:CAMPEP_0184660410 /NCGR_PEP_ID=MMETSP0308-20130426/33792_1 /TAXON_ID=38269 /ORGANISM="Gloeochaete witrockiana, Strain SAG 46.84" /LENGTH=141 /DNA_ID=CAMNT_0027100973 /DNA_START=141 /DNA_END=566 /DNA_ORIENTATION=+
MTCEVVEVSPLETWGERQVSCGFCSQKMNTSVFAVSSDDNIVALCSLKCYRGFSLGDKKGEKSPTEVAESVPMESGSPRKKHAALLHHLFQKEHRKRDSGTSTPVSSPSPLESAILHRRELRHAETSSLLRGIVSRVGGRR